MKIIIVPSDKTVMQHGVILDHPSDDLTCEEALQLAKRALVAWGYPHSCIFEEED